jgi:hypothetical protein
VYISSTAFLCPSLAPRSGHGGRIRRNCPGTSQAPRGHSTPIPRSGRTSNTGGKRCDDAALVCLQAVDALADLQVSSSYRSESRSLRPMR